MKTRRYRWLIEGGYYEYRAKPGKGNDAYRKKVCKVLTVPSGGGPGNASIAFADGHTMVVPAGTLKKIEL